MNYNFYIQCIDFTITIISSSTVTLLASFNNNNFIIFTYSNTHQQFHQNKSKLAEPIKYQVSFSQEASDQGIIFTSFPSIQLHKSLTKHKPIHAGKKSFFFSPLV